MYAYRHAHAVRQVLATAALAGGTVLTVEGVGAALVHST